MAAKPRGSASAMADYEAVLIALANEQTGRALEVRATSQERKIATRGKCPRAFRRHRRNVVYTERWHATRAGRTALRSRQRPRDGIPWSHFPLSIFPDPCPRIAREFIDDRRSASQIGAGFVRL